MSAQLHIPANRVNSIAEHLAAKGKDRSTPILKPFTPQTDDARLLPATTPATAPPGPYALNTSNFVYTLDKYCDEYPGTLTLEERQFYEDNGYIIKRGLVRPDMIERMNNHFLDYVAGKIEPDGAMSIVRDLGMLRKVKEGLLPAEYAKSEFGVYKVQGFFDNTFMDWVRYPEILQVARCMAGEDLKSTHHMYINKPPDVGNTGIHPLHQDMAYFPWSNPSNVVACWTAMADVTKENGCLVVLPGSHKGGLHDHSVPQWMVGNAGFHTVADMEWRGDDATKAGLQYAEMKAGDTIFFHPFVIHGSGFNNTKQCRKSMTVHYASARSKYFSVADTPQDYVAKEIMTSLLKVPAKDVDPEQARQLQIANWKFTSRQVAGHDYRAELHDEQYL